MLFEPSITVDLTANRRFLLRRLEAIRDYVRPSFKRHKSGIVLLVLDGGRSLCFFDCQVKGTKSLTQTRPPQQLAGSCNSNLNLYNIKKLHLSNSFKLHLSNSFFESHHGNKSSHADYQARCCSCFTEWCCVWNPWLSFTGEDGVGCLRLRSKCYR